MKNMEVEYGAGLVPEKQQGDMSVTSPPGKSSMGVNKDMDLSNILSTALIIPNELGKDNDINLSNGHSTSFQGNTPGWCIR